MLPERGIMAPDPADFAKGESPMTDLQFNAYIELRDKYEALLQELAELRRRAPASASAHVAEESTSDYQFQKYEQLRNKNEDLNKEIALLRKENARLKMQIDMLMSNSKRLRQ
jgi:seryl-tRNA synthetase